MSTDLVTFTLKFHSKRSLFGWIGAIVRAERVGENTKQAKPPKLFPWIQALVRVERVGENTKQAKPQNHSHGLKHL